MTAASPTTLARAKAGDQGAFSDLVNPYRRQLLVHCYRILGSVQDAEDVLQEVLLSAWAPATTASRPIRRRAARSVPLRDVLGFSASEAAGIPRVHSGVGEQRAAKSESRLSAVAPC